MLTRTFLFHGCMAVSSLLLAPSCKTTATVSKRAASYEPLAPVPDTSVVSIPVKIYRKEVETAINRALPDTIYEDNNLAGDGLEILVQKKGEISLRFSGDSLSYVVPVSIFIRRDIGIGTVAGKGSLALYFSTQYSIGPDWSLRTSTVLVSYQWLVKPVLKTQLVDIPITPIVDYFLNRSKIELAKEIDGQVKDFFSLREQVENVWREMHEPFLLSEEYAAWMLLQPIGLSLAPFQLCGDILEGKVEVVSKPIIMVGPKPSVPNVQPLPNFRQGIGAKDSFQVFIGTHISFEEAARISASYLVGETFKQGRKKVEIQEVGIYGKGNKLVVRTRLKGDYNGDIYFTGKPAFRSKENTIVLEDVDFDFSSRRALLKTASWLFKGRLHRTVEKSLNFYLNYNIEDTRQTIRNAMNQYELATGIFLDGELHALNISRIYITADGIRVSVGLNGRLTINVRGLGI